MTSSGGYRGRHGLDADDVERAAQIIAERGQAELGAHVGEAAHREGARIHCSMLPNGCSTASLRRSRIAGLA